MKKRLLMTLAVAVVAATGCRSFILETVMTTVEPYFHGPGIDGTQFEQVSDKAYTFRWNWYRNLIIVTDAGLVVIDPMNTEMATALKHELDRKFPDKKIHTLIYSHYHLDHTRGGAALAPLEVIAHEKCATYWKDFEHRDVLEPTRVITGDTTLDIGGVEIRALYLGLSHTDTLYAFHVPSEKLVFTADLGLVRSVAPVGVPDRYAPGYLAALNRVAALDFDIFVPSHFGYGTKHDLTDWRDMLEDGRQLARAALRNTGSLGTRERQMARYFDTVYYPMRAKYGSWHGFNEMFILNLVRDLEGEMLGH
ncbi:MAG: MBL fold metallo-hydrolase [Gammaproteobacteria bacterium]|nr:MBL fold metallo-hydrolase [Gammaproteobacteria bacterium]